VGSDLPETFDAAYGCMLMKRLLLHHIVQPEALNVEKAPMQDVLKTCGQETSMPWLLAAAISMCKVSLLGFKLLLKRSGTPQEEQYGMADCPSISQALHDLGND
jgi:hypothetical protein